MNGMKENNFQTSFDKG